MWRTQARLDQKLIFARFFGTASVRLLSLDQSLVPEVLVGVVILVILVVVVRGEKQSQPSWSLTKNLSIKLIKSVWETPLPLHSLMNPGVNILLKAGTFSGLVLLK